MSRRSALFFLSMLAACAPEPTPAVDASVPDAAPSFVACPEAGQLVRVSTLDPIGVEAPSVTLRGVVPTDDGFYVAAYRPADDWGSAEEIVVELDARGEIVRTTPASASYGPWTSAGIALAPNGELAMFGARSDAERFETTFWARTVTDGNRRTLFETIVRDTADLIESSALTTHSRAPRAWFLRGGALMSFELEIPDEGELPMPEPTLVAADWVEGSAHLVATAIDETHDCLLTRERTTGRLTIATLSTTEGLVDRRVLVERGALATPFPLVIEGECAVAWFEPSLERPMTSVLRSTRSDQTLLGWGTPPYGMQLLPEGIVLAFWAQDASGVGLAWVPPDADACRPVARVVSDELIRSAPLGQVIGARGPTSSVIVTADLEEPGRLSVFRLVTD